MLSTENPPPDPPCPHLKSHSSDALPELAPDLSNNFSIRDYVFTSRRKDIEKNWPFSSKNLQLCLKHGVKDLLPPFGCTDTARRGSFVRRAVETGKIDDANDCLARDRSDDAGLLSWKVVDPCAYGEKDFPSTTTSVSLSEIESVSANKLCSSQSVGPRKSENSARLLKKCRLIVKFGGNFDRSSTEDIASNTTTVSETMASKVCPVCKTFSSSSNTTLNAHIDQCLSGEPTRKGTSDCKVNRHRIKPSKTRSMVDVYSTAKSCTLEELDRRNGTNWAATSSLACQDAETLGAEGRKERVSQVHRPEEAGDVGAVYIDSSGTKVRILSKSNDAPVVSKGVDVEAGKAVKEDKVHKLFASKKKMKHVLKNQKFLRLTLQSKKLRSYDKALKSQIVGGQEKVNPTRVDGEKSSKVPHFQSFDRGTFGTGLARKVKSKDCHRPLRHDSVVDRSHVQRLANSSKNAGSFAEVNDTMESSSHEASDSERQWSPRRKRLRSSLVAHRINRDADKAFSSLKQKSGGALSIRETLKWNTSLIGKEAVETHDDDSDTPPCASMKPPKAMRLLSLRSKCDALKTSSLCKNSQMHGKSSQQQEIMQVCTVNRSGREYISDDEDSSENSISTSQREEAMVDDNNEGKSVDFSYRDSDDDDFSDEYDSIEFSRREVQIHGEDIVADDDSPSKLAVEIQSDSLQPMEDYNEPVCGEEEETRKFTNVLSFEDQPVMFSGEVNRGAEQGSSFLEVDPIPIPGPPGSFLPSPGGDDSSDEGFQGNSSLTTSRFLSSQDQHELLNNRGSSDSPVSATSSISNSTASRFDVNHTEPLPARSCAVKEKFETGFYGTVDIDKGRPSLRNDDQPCCCSRKDRVTEGATLNYDEPQLLRRQTIAFVENPSARHDHVGKAFSYVAPLPLHGAADAGVRFSGRGDSELASPSSPNPVLRLMGKNLMVVNRDEDTSTAHVAVQPPSPYPQYGHPTSPFPTFPGIYPGNTRNQDYVSLHPFINQGLVNFSQEPLNPGMPNRFPTPPSFCAPVRPTFPNQHTGGSFAVYTEPHELYRGESYLPTRHDRPRNRASTTAGTSSAVKDVVVVIDSGSECETANVFSPYRQAGTTTFSKVNASGVKWSCTSEGPPGMVQRTLYNGAVLAPPPTSHARSVHYYSPSLS